MPQLGAAMAIRKAIAFLLASSILLGSLPIPGHGHEDAGNLIPKSPEEVQAEVNLPVLHTEKELQGFGREGLWRWGYRNARRLLIGSTAPTCTYNECRGCRFKCRAEQVPVDANDPINSAYHYRCVCHKY